MATEVSLSTQRLIVAHGQQSHRRIRGSVRLPQQQVRVCWLPWSSLLCFLLSAGICFVWSCQHLTTETHRKFKFAAHCGSRSTCRSLNTTLNSDNGINILHIYSSGESCGDTRDFREQFAISAGVRVLDDITLTSLETVQ